MVGLDARGQGFPLDPECCPEWAHPCCLQDCLRPQAGVSRLSLPLALTLKLQDVRASPPRRVRSPFRASAFGSGFPCGRSPQARELSSLSTSLATFFEQNPGSPHLSWGWQPAHLAVTHTSLQALQASPGGTQGHPGFLRTHISRWRVDRGGVGGDLSVLSDAWHTPSTWQGLGGEQRWVL